MLQKPELSAGTSELPPALFLKFVGLDIDFFKNYLFIFDDSDNLFSSQE